MSAQGRPLVHQVISVIDKLTEVMDEIIANQDIHIAVRAGAIAGLAVLNKYYSKTDESIVYRLSIRKYVLVIRVRR